METLVEINGTKLKAAREAKELIQSALAHLARVPTKVVIQAETQGRITESYLNRVSTALETSPDMFRDEELIGTARHEAVEICDTILKALRKAHYAGREAVERPHSIDVDKTLPTKITDRNAEDDPTEPVDFSTERVIRETILSESSKQGHPFQEGFDYIVEESGYRRFTGGMLSAKRRPKHCLFIDSADDTSQYRRNLAGTSLIGVYRQNLGWICCAAVDALHARLFSAIRGLHPTASQLPSSPNGSAELRTLHLGPSGKKGLEGSCANMYLGKPYRILEAGKTYATLLSDANGIKEIVSFGGSRGGLLCAQGIIDFAVEMKGFRLIDCMPGVFIAKHSGCCVIDENGRPFGFGPDRKLEEVLEKPGSGESIVDYVKKRRRKFICAATEALARQVHSQLGGNNKGLGAKAEKNIRTADPAPTASRIEAAEGRK